MMGPEAAQVYARWKELEGMGGYAGPMPPLKAPMYAEAAVRAHLEPPSHAAAGPWARVRAALRAGRGGRAAPGAAWTVAAAPLVAKAGLVAAPKGRRYRDVPLAALPAGALLSP